jgi:hypothetical protein
VSGHGCVRRALARGTGLGRRRGCVGLRGARRRLVVLRLHADRGHALAGDHHSLGPAVGVENPDQAAVAEAVHHLGEGAALELEAIGQGQDREVGALRGGAEDHELGVAELGHGRISICGERPSPSYDPCTLEGVQGTVCALD